MFDLGVEIGSVSKMTWSEDGTSLAFLAVQKSLTQLFSYYLSVGRLHVLEEEPFINDFEISKNDPLQFSNDGKRLFFKARPRNGLPKNEADAVQVWNAADKWIYPGEQIVKGFTRTSKLMMWEPEKEHLMQITDKKMPDGLLTTDYRYAIVSNPKTYEPQFKNHPDRDYYITELATGKKRPFLERQPFKENVMRASPEGGRIAYFREGHWFVYNILTDQHLCLTDKIEQSFGINYWTLLSSSYGFGGWTKDGLSVLLYDKFDVWLVAADGSKGRRLTRGREEGNVYRVLQADNEHVPTEYMIEKSFICDFGKGVILTSENTDHTASGLYHLNDSFSLAPFYTDAKRIYNFNRNANSLLWIAESYTAPPVLCFSAGLKKSVKIAGSNKHLSRFAVPRRDIVHYASGTGKELRGLLYYPAGYAPDKNYPMVTHIYELQSHRANYFLTPSLSSEIGFDVGHYVNNGYFVFLPDILCEKDQVGSSALWCIENALNEVQKVTSIDRERIGLVGHSFGGFETDYIISHTDRFACAVAGSAITNLVSSALSVSRYDKKPNMYKSLDGQLRMSASPANDAGTYMSNSPVLHVQDIATPLLAWTGLEDGQVEPTQSFEMYMAMRWAGKNHILLAYPEEHHGLENPQNILDLGNKTMQWFDHYLKGSPREKWMEPTQ